MHWFRIGRIEVTTTVAVVLLAAAGSVIGTFGGFVAWLAFSPALVLSGEVWRLFTWPWVDGLSLFTALTLLVFWYFGKLIEAEIGRNQMARFLVGLWAILTASHLLAGMVLPGMTLLIGLGLPELLLLLFFILEQPNRPFIFGVKAWVIGAILIGIQILSLIAGGQLGSIVALFVSIGLGMHWARRFGLLSHLTWIPSSGRKRARAARRPRPARPTKEQRQAMSDEDRLDELLAKISSTGMDGLTRQERQELLDIHERRQRTTTRGNQ